MKVKCQMDEDGIRCPLAELELNNEDAPNEVVMDAVKQSCSSKICRENALDLLGYVNDVSKEASVLLQSSISQIANAGNISEDNLNSILQDQTSNGEEIQTYVNVLKEESCAAQANTNASKAITSDATTLRSIGSLFVKKTAVILKKILKKKKKKKKKRK